MPWKNGGGTTTEVARAPADATLDDFDWRISIASVASDGPFSRFEGVDRSITVLEGAGMTLAFDGRGDVTIGTASAPLAFPADVGVGATLVSGPTADFNVMTRRGRWRHLVTKATVRGSRVVTPHGDGLLLFVVSGELEANARRGLERLGRRDALLVESRDPLELVGSDGASVLAVDLWRA